MELGKKMVVLVGAGLGAGIPRVLERVDAQMSIDWVKSGKGKDPESYPLYYRPGIMIPTIAGTTSLIAGLFGDKYMSEDTQLALLTAGTGLTVGAIDNISTALDGRKKAGVPLVFPDPKVQYNGNCAWRSIGGPGYMVGCGSTGTAPGQIVDPPYDLTPHIVSGSSGSSGNSGVRVGF